MGRAGTMGDRAGAGAGRVPPGQGGYGLAGRVPWSAGRMHGQGGYRHGRAGTGFALYEGNQNFLGKVFVIW